MATQVVRKEPAVPISVWALPVFLGWLIPGGGHFLLKRRGRAILILASVTLMFFNRSGDARGYVRAGKRRPADHRD